MTITFRHLIVSLVVVVTFALGVVTGRITGPSTPETRIIQQDNSVQVACISAGRKWIPVYGYPGGGRCQ